MPYDAPTLPRDLDRMRIAIATFAARATGLTAYWGEQDAPPPPLSDGYVRVSFTANFASLGGHVEIMSSTPAAGLIPETATRTTEIDDEATLSMMVCTRDDATTARAALGIEGALIDPEQMMVLRRAGLAYAGEKINARLPRLTAGQWEHRAAVDFRIRARARWIRTNVPLIREIAPPVVVTPSGDIQLSIASPT